MDIIHNSFKTTHDQVAIIMTNVIHIKRKKRYLVLFVMQISFTCHENISFPDGHGVCQKQKYLPIYSRQTLNASSSHNRNSYTHV